MPHLESLRELIHSISSILTDLHHTVIELGALAFTIMFIVRVFLHEIRRK